MVKNLSTTNDNYEETTSFNIHDNVDIVDYCDSDRYTKKSKRNDDSYDNFYEDFYEDSETRID